jgi:hypothetical protein
MRVAPWAPIAALPIMGAAVAANWSAGDIRTGLFPWAMAAGFVLLAICPLALLRAHHQPRRLLTISGWWTTLAVLGPAGFFASVAVGGLLGIDEETVGALGILPVASMAFGILTLPVAATLFGLGLRASRQKRLARRSAVAIMVAGWVPAAQMTYGGLVEGTAETVGAATLAALFVVLWIIAGTALPMETPVADEP